MDDRRRGWLAVLTILVSPRLLSNNRGDYFFNCNDKYQSNVKVIISMFSGMFINNLVNRHQRLPNPNMDRRIKTIYFSIHPKTNPDSIIRAGDF